MHDPFVGSIHRVCTGTCCLIGDAGICEDDAAVCGSCVALPSDAGTDACLPTANVFGCFSAADCPPEPPPPAWSLEGPVACCVGGLFGVSTFCQRTGLFGCGLLESKVCNDDSDCTNGMCRPVVVNGVVLPFRACP